MTAIIFCCHFLKFKNTLLIFSYYFFPKKLYQGLIPKQTYFMTKIKIKRDTKNVIKWIHTTRIDIWPTNVHIWRYINYNVFIYIYLFVYIMCCFSCKGVSTTNAEVIHDYLDKDKCGSKCTSNRSALFEVQPPSLHCRWTNQIKRLSLLRALISTVVFFYYTPIFIFNNYYFRVPTH